MLTGLSSNKKIFGENFNIGSGRNVSVNDVTREILKLTKKGEVEHGPSVIESKDTLADISKSSGLLDWKPKSFLFEHNFLFKRKVCSVSG